MHKRIYNKIIVTLISGLDIKERTVNAPDIKYQTVRDTVDT